MSEPARAPIPVFTTERQHAELAEALRAAAERVIASNSYILGSEGAAFESEFAEWLPARRVVGTANGAEAIQVALMACGVGPGDEVITAPNTSPYTVLGILAAGARAVLADIDPTTYTLDPAAIERALTARTRAIVPVHLYGHPADMQPVLDLARMRGLRVIEDACQAHGSQYRGRPAGALGDAGAFSFYPTKNLGALGDAGAVVTNDEGVALLAARLRNGGRENRDHHALAGLNSRLDEMQAALLRVKLPRLQAWNARRRALARRYGERLAGARLELPREAPGTTHVYHLFVVRCAQRDALRAFLAARGIGVGVHYPIPVHLHAGFRSLGYGPGAFPRAEQAAREVLSLPIFPELSLDEVDRVCDAIVEFEGGHA